MDGGVRSKRIAFNPEHWDFVPLPWANEHEVRQFYEQTEGEPYGWSDLIKRQIFNRPGNNFGWFCSEWCAAALGLTTPQQFSPATLGDYCKSRSEK